MNELIHLRNEVSKTYDLGGGKRRCVISGAIHYKDNYADPSEQWKDINPTIVDNKVTTAPYELTIDGKKLTFKDKKTGEVSTLELLSVFPPGIPFEIKPFNGGVSFQHTLPSDKIPFQAQFRVTGNARLRTRAFDDKGELELGTSLVDGILTENLSQVKDKTTGLARAAVGNIRIDPDLTVQPSAKDTTMDEHQTVTCYGDSAAINLYDAENPPYSDTNRIILEFDISELPEGQAIDSASLELFHSGGDAEGKTVWAYKLTRTDWIEGIFENPSTSGATWVDYKINGGHFPWTTPGGDYVTVDPIGGSLVFPSGSSAWRAWNVLAIVQDAYDGSNPAEFLLRFAIEHLESGDSYLSFRSKEYATDPDLQPKLVIDYSPAPPPEVEKKHTFRLHPRPGHRMEFEPNLKLG